ncbi:aconitate hydratase, partial [Staphylococcus epidermidis]
TNLLGVKTVIAQSYERIHRSNLVMMGVLPLQFKDGESADSLGLNGREEISVDINEDVQPHDIIKVHAKKESGEVVDFDVIVRFDSQVEIDYYRRGGILQMVLRNKLAQ